MTDLPAIQKDPMRAFQDQLQERVRNDIRDLLPEDAVQALVTKAVENEFFAPRIVKPDSWGSRSEEKPSWFVSEVIKAAEPIIKQAVQKAVEESPQLVERVIAEYLNQNKLAAAVATQLNQTLIGAVVSLQEALRNRH